MPPQLLPHKNGRKTEGRRISLFCSIRVNCSRWVRASEFASCVSLLISFAAAAFSCNFRWHFTPHLMTNGILILLRRCSFNRTVRFLGHRGYSRIQRREPHGHVKIMVAARKCDTRMTFNLSHSFDLFSRRSFKMSWKLSILQIIRMAHFRQRHSDNCCPRTHTYLLMGKWQTIFR